MRRPSAEAAPLDKVHTDNTGRNHLKDQHDLGAFHERTNEPNLPFEDVVKGLRTRR